MNTQTDPTPADAAFARLLAMFPNAYPHHGFAGVDIPMDDDTYIIVTDDGDYTVGIYTDGAWQDGDDPDIYVVFDVADAAVTYINDLTELTPEGVDWATWAVQWTTDALCDDRIDGAHIRPRLDGATYSGS